MEYFSGRATLGFDGSFVDWLTGHGSSGGPVVDRVVTRHAANVPLWSLVDQRESRIALRGDVLDLVWVEG